MLFGSDSTEPLNRKLTNLTARVEKLENVIRYLGFELQVSNHVVGLLTNLNEEQLNTVFEQVRTELGKTAANPNASALIKCSNCGAMMNRYDAACMVCGTANPDTIDPGDVDWSFPTNEHG